MNLSASPTMPPLKVAVLINHRPNHAGETGGLAGTWERVSRVAQGRTDLDLTVFFLGARRQEVVHAPNVRHVLLPPVFGTERLPFLQAIPTHTDLAPFHPTLFRQLCGFHVLHTTDTFHAFARTALWKRRVHGVPLVTSVQTDTIGWARIHTPAILQRLLPGWHLTHWLLQRYHYLDRQERAMERRFGRYVRRCQAVFVSHRRDQERAACFAPNTPRQFLRRGIDLHQFHPRWRDRHALEAQFGIPAECLLLLFVGRLDAVKGVLLAAEVVQQLVAHGYPVHFLVVGHGVQRQDVLDRLGQHVTLTGNLPHDDLARIYASADLLLFPSEAEVWPNVVVEARACGLPVIACEAGAAHVMPGANGDGVLLPTREASTWIAATMDLLKQPAVLPDMGRRARCAVEAHMPSWQGVLEEDLLPVWRRVAGR